MELDLSDKLTPSNWEKALLENKPYIKSGWKSALTESDLIIIDLSKVEWVEPGTVVRLVLFVEAGLVEGLNFEIRLPLQTRSSHERDITHEATLSQDPKLLRKLKFINRHVERRRDSAAVLDRFGLRKVLLAPHIQVLKGKCKIIDTFDWSLSAQSGLRSRSSKLQSIQTPVDREHPWYVGVVFPMCWIPDPRTPEGKAKLEEMSLVDVLADVIVHPSYRIAAADGQTLAHVFLKELVENVYDHSGKHHALVAAWRRPREVEMKQAELLESDRPFAAWCSRYPLIELTVGDSGVGLPSSLHKEFIKKQRPLPAELAGSNENSRTLIWALDKWSTRSPTEKQRGTRGLYRVERVVRKYDGFLSLRAEHSYAGVDAHTQEYFAYPHRLARSPGTVCQVRLPVMIVQKQPPVPESTRAHIATQTQVIRFPDLNWQKSPKQSIATLTQSVTERASALSSSGAAACLIVDLVFASLDRHVLEELLRELVQIAHPVAIVVLNLLAPSWDSTEQTIDSLMTTSQNSTAEAKDHINVVDPILLVHGDGHHAWVGATQQVARVLDMLLRKGRLLPDALNIDSLPSEQFNSFLRQIVEDYHVVHRLPGSSFSSRVDLAAAEDALRLAILKEVEESIIGQTAKATPNVAYRTPSLQLVSCFLNVDDILGPDLKSRLAVLARECVDRLGLESLCGRLAIITDSKTSWNVLEAFRQQLQLRLGNRLHVESQQLGPSDIPVIQANTYAVAFTTVILTGSLLARLSAQIVRAKRMPRAAIAVVDARCYPDLPLEAMGQTLPVVSLARVQTRYPTDRTPEKILDISPFSFDIEHPDSHTRPLYSIPVERLKEMIAIDGGIYFAHVWRPNGRHFTFYLDASELLGMAEATRNGAMSSSGQEILSAFLAQADHWRSRQAVDLVCYPVTERPSAAEFISERLAKHLQAALCPISRAGEASHWRFPGRISTPVAGAKPDLFTEAPSIVPNRVILIDWGAITGRSILAMIRLAAKAGAKHVGVIIFLSQLSEDDEELLRALDSIKVDQSPEPVRVSVTFLSRLLIRPYDTEHCPHCRQLHRLLLEEKSLPQSLLQEFLSEARGKLRPVSLSRLKAPGLGDPPALEPIEIFEMAILRDRLERSAVSTRERWNLYLDIDHAANEYSQGSNDLKSFARRWIHFLAAEWPWLKQEPLSLGNFRKALARLTVEVAVHPESLESERIDSLIVLRTASKEEFARAIPRLFESLLSQRRVLNQLYYCIFTYLERDYLFPALLRPLVEALKKCSETIIHSGITVEKLEEVGLTHVTLEHYGRYLLGTPSNPTQSEAWRKLRNEFDSRYHVHHPVCMAADALRMNLLEPLIEDSSKPLPKLNWSLIRKRWEEHCIPFLLDRVLPYVRNIRGVIGGFDARLILARSADLNGLAELTDEKIFSEPAVVSWYLQEFEQDPQSVRRPGKWRAFANARDRISNLLLNPGDIDSRKGGSALIRLLIGCPTNLREVIPSEIVSSPLDSIVKVEWRTEGPELLVFCHESTVSEVLGELLKNVRKHCEDVTRVQVISSLSEYGVTVEVLNNGRKRTLPDDRKSHKVLSLGLETCRERLQAYGAQLKVDESRRGDWTFAVTVEFERG